MDKIPKKYRTKKWYFLFGLGVLVVLLMGNVMVNWVTNSMGGNSSSPQPVAAAPPPPTATPVPTRPVIISDLMMSTGQIPEVYRFEHFIKELHLCHMHVGERKSEKELEDHVINHLRASVQALVDQYSKGVCEEVLPYYAIPGRLVWFVKKLNQGRVADKDQ